MRTITVSIGSHHEIRLQLTEQAWLMLGATDGQRIELAEEMARETAYSQLREQQRAGRG